MDISGKLSELLDGLPVSYDNIISFIGKPIIEDKNFKQIGVIDRIDISKNEWYGHICDHAEPPLHLIKRFNYSFEIVPEKEN